jgi:amino acid transporter
VLTAVSTGGLIYAVNGFQPPVDLSGEARNPRRDVPRAILISIGVAVLLYLLLQFAFLVAIPDSALAHGWNGISFTSPFGQLALLLNLGWLSSLLYADAVLSPGGSEFVGTAQGARATYALVGVPIFFAVRTKDRPLAADLRAGAWLVVYLLGLLGLSVLGSFGGNRSLGAPWDSIVVGVLSVAVYLWAVRAGRRHIEETAGRDVGDSASVSDALTAVAAGRSSERAGEEAVAVTG